MPEKKKALSVRQLEVLRLVARGRSNAEIAAKLRLSEDTIKSHMRTVFRFYKVGTRYAAVSRAYGLGHIEPPAAHRVDIRSRLTPEQLRVAELCGTDLTRKAMGRVLGVTEYQAGALILAARARVGARDRAHLVSMYYASL